MDKEPLPPLAREEKNDVAVYTRANTYAGPNIYRSKGRPVIVAKGSEQDEALSKRQPDRYTAMMKLPSQETE